MKDCVGQELSIGDKVVCSDGGYAELFVGEVVKFTPKKIQVKCYLPFIGPEAVSIKLKTPLQVYKVEG